MSVSDLEDPTSVTEARAAVNKVEWEKYMESEIRSLLYLDKAWDYVYWHYCSNLKYISCSHTL